jgi:colicin import membrane protein
MQQTHFIVDSNAYQRNRALLVFAIVLVIHLSLVVFFNYSSLTKPVPIVKPRVVVQTIQLKSSPIFHMPAATNTQAEPKIEQKVTVPDPIPKSTPVPSSIPTQKRIAVPVPEKMQPKVNPKTPQIKAVPAKPVQKVPAKKVVESPKINSKPKEKSKEELQKEVEQQKKQEVLKEKLAYLAESRHQIKSLSTEKTESIAVALPSQLTSLHVDTVTIEEIGKVQAWGAKEATYREQVASYLRKTLKLQELGAVKIQLTIDRSGKIIKHQVLSSESKKNLEYIQKALPALVFPSFGESLFKGASDYTILITLDNA